MIPKCYRVWFVDGSARLVDAHNLEEARDFVIQLDKEDGLETEIRSVECLTKDVAAIHFERFLVSAKAALEFMERVEHYEWERGSSETDPEVEEFREAIRQAEIDSGEYILTELNEVIEIRTQHTRSIELFKDARGYYYGLLGYLKELA